MPNKKLAYLLRRFQAMYHKVGTFYRVTNATYVVNHEGNHIQQLGQLAKNLHEASDSTEGGIAGGESVWDGMDVVVYWVEGSITHGGKDYGKLDYCNYVND